MCTVDTESSSRLLHPDANVCILSDTDRQQGLSDGNLKPDAAQYIMHDSYV